MPHNQAVTKPSNVLCMPTSICKPAVRAKKDIESVLQYREKKDKPAELAPHIDRSDLMKEYIQEMREIAFRMEAIVKIAERACEGCAR